MSNLVNLRQVRKQKARGEAEAEAAANRARFGRTKAEKVRDAAEQEALVRQTDQAKLD
jgi:hypothetical protein